MKKQTLAVSRKIYGLIVYIVMSAVFLFPGVIHAQESDKTVRVGWYESSFNTTDSTGRRSGYAYEYQQKLAAYTNWKYEYVSGSWPVLMQMLIDGKLDLLSDVSYTPEREKSMLFPVLPMGTEEYYLFVNPGSGKITPDSLSSVSGKKVGVNRGSVQAEFLRDWAGQNGIEAEIIEVSCTEDESLQMLRDGDLDAYVTVDSFTDPELAAPVFKIGSSDFYFAVNKDRPDLLTDLNMGMSRIQDEDRYYNQQMSDRYFNSSGVNAFLSADETGWLAGHGPIRVGYQDNYLAFCAQDKTTGELTGALKDYLACVSDCMENAHIDFQTIAYPTVSTAMEALKNGEVDCVFPANLSSYDGEKMGVLMSPPILRTDIHAVVRMSEQNDFSRKKHVIVAVNEGNPNYDTFLLDHFPDWKRVYYPTTELCLEAVGDRVADCVLISYYRFNNIARQCERNHLTAFSTGLALDYCFAVAKDSPELYSILAKTAGRVPDSTMGAALSYYISEDARLTFFDFITDHLAVVMAGVTAVLLIILFLMLRSIRAEKKARELISATETDDLTGLYNRKYFFRYADQRYHEHPDLPMDAIVLNIEQFHSVNALNGREFGDRVLFLLGSEIREISDRHGGIAGRFEADRFDIYCRHTEDYREIFDHLQGKLDDLAPNISIRMRMGVMPWQAGLEPEQLFDKARTACSMARGHYKEHLIIFNEDVDKREMYEQRLLNDLRRALDAFEFEVYYQPKFDIRSDEPRLVGMEALVRWNHPELGMIPPDDFIPLFERNGRIGEIDKCVWSQAARQIMRWREQYGITIPASVNLSRVDVFDPALEETLEGILEANGLDHNDLKLEVTESAYTENAEQVIRVVENLRRKGYKVEMDDFGTGYSSLNMLSDMPVDVLKMDRAFIRNIEHEEKDIQLVALILGIADNLKIPVIAEGVETKVQVQLLKNLGCACVQGFYFSRPLHPVDFEATYLQKTVPTE